MPLLLKWKFPLFLGVLLSVCYLHFFENRAYVELDISVSQKSWFNIYWADEEQGYSQWKRTRVRVTPDRQQYNFYLTDLRNIDRLRIDPHDYIGEVVLQKLLLSQKGFHPLQFDTIDDLSLLKPIFHIDTCLAEKGGLKIQSTGNDPQLELMVSLLDGPSRSMVVFISLAAIFFFVFLFFFLTENFRTEAKFVPLFFSVVFVLIIVMASSSAKNVHPDEYVHLYGGEYYKTNWLPPVIDDPEIHHTYSVYGVSRLNSREIAYLFIGKLAEVMSLFKVTDFVTLRMFNVLLFGVVLLYLLKNQAARIMAVPLLISPQLWYIFSYCNSDAFALAVSFFAACQLALPNSMLNGYLLGEKKEKKLWVILLLGILCGLLFLLKKNYLFFYVFLAGYLGWRVLFLVEQEKRKQYLKRMVVVVLLGMSLAGVRIGADYAVNGMNRTEKVEQTREKLATHLYKPSTPLEEQHAFLNRKARGESLQTIIIIDRWFEKTYRSAFGMYGYFTAAGSDSYYNAIRSMGIALLGLMSLAILFRGGLTGNLLFAIFLCCSGALIGVSLYHSWTADYQTQGRYLFPIIPMGCVVVYHARQHMQEALFKLLVSAMFLLSVYSFVFVALLKLPKIS